VPERTFGDRLIVARPRDGAPVELGPTAVLVWQLLDGSREVEDLDRDLADLFPEVLPGERARARREIVVMLLDDDLVERS
jgi:hypothetical protein